MGSKDVTVGAEPGDAPLRPKAPLWVDRWLGGRCAVLLTFYQKRVAKRDPNSKGESRLKLRKSKPCFVSCLPQRGS